MQKIETGTYTYLQIQQMGGFEELRKQGMEYYELYHLLPNGEFEGHDLYEVYREGV